MALGSGNNSILARHKDVLYSVDTTPLTDNCSSFLVQPPITMEATGASSPSQTSKYVQTDDIDMASVSEDEDGDYRGLMYAIDDVPPWYLTIFLGFQHFLTMFGGPVTIPYILAPALCIANDHPARAYIISSIIFVAGIVTFFQSTVGVRLPIIQSSGIVFVIPMIAHLSSPEWICPSVNGASQNQSTVNNSTEDRTFEDDPDEQWKRRLREVQGAIIVASLFEALIAISGLLSILQRFITPLVITPVITLIGISLFDTAAKLSSGNWLISSLTILLLVVFSQILRDIKFPYFSFSGDRRCKLGKLPVFKMFPVLMTIFIAWFLSAILTHFHVFPSGNVARTDLNMKIMSDAHWFYIPYPGQWGWPTVSFAGVFGMLAAIMSSIVESIGDYYACARLSGAPPPPVHAINRGIFIEGIGCVIAGLCGTGNATTSSSPNVGAVGITKVGSRRVVQVAAVLMILFGVVSKFGALFVTIPEPIIGGVFFVLFSTITAVGLSNLQFVRLNSSRNLCVIGLPLFCGLAIPHWLKKNGDAIQTGAPEVDKILKVILSTSMFVGGFLGLVLDNVIPGTDDERGIKKWTEQHHKNEFDPLTITECYDLPFGMSYLQRSRIAKYIPISPTYVPPRLTCRR